MRYSTYSIDKYREEYVSIDRDYLFLLDCSGGGEGW